MISKKTFFILLLSGLIFLCISSVSASSDFNGTDFQIDQSLETLMPHNDNFHFFEITQNTLNKNQNNDVNSTNSDNSNNNVKNISVSSGDVVEDVIFEGKKVYVPGDMYSVKFISNAKNLKGYNATFSVRGTIIGTSNIDDNGIASFKLPVFNLNKSINCVIDSSIFNVNSDDFYTVGESITLTPRIADGITKGSLLPKWRNVTFTLCDDGYHSFIDNHTYQLIKFDGSSCIVHKEKLNNTNQLKSFFNKISGSNALWDLIIIDLAPVEYKVDFTSYSDREWDYALKFNYGQLIINGNGAKFKSNLDINFAAICKNTNVILNNITLDSFCHCFYNYGLCYCYKVKFSNNIACKLDVGIDGSGSVLHNYNVAEFRECIFDGNDAKFWGWGKEHMQGSILFAEPYSTTYFYHCEHSGKGIPEKDPIFACKYSSVIFIPIDRAGESRWTWDNFVGKSFFHPLATMTMIRSDENISKEYYNKTYNPYVFNCSNSKQLHDALSSINNAGVKGSEVIINLVNTNYEYSIKTDFHEDWEAGYRGNGFWSIHDEKYSDFQYDNRYFLNAGGFVPITINGNGAKIKLTDNSDNKDNHFAFIGKNGFLTINDVSLSKFNTVFINSLGNLVCNRCIFDGNVIDYTINKRDEGGVLRSYGASTKFINCTFKDNLAGSKNSDIFYAVDGSHVDFENCKITPKQITVMEKVVHYTKTFLGLFDIVGTLIKVIKNEPVIKPVDHYYGTLIDSTIKCPKDLYQNHVLSEDSTFIDVNAPENPYYAVNVTGNFNSLDFSKFSNNVNLINFCKDNTADLNKLSSHLGTFYFKSNGFNVKINSNLNVGKKTIFFLEGFKFDKFEFSNNGNIFFVNCTFTNCDFDSSAFKNKGVNSFINCIISNCHCENVFDNDGSLSFINTLFTNNKASEYGIVYNKGDLLCVNTTFISSSGANVYNFRTVNYVGLNSSVGNVIFKEPMAAWKLDAIKAGCLAATVIVSGGAGYAISACMSSAIAGLSVLVSQATGLIAGGAIGAIYGAIEGSTLHDYSGMMSSIGNFAMIGFMSSTIFQSPKINNDVEMEIEVGTDASSESQSAIEDAFNEIGENGYHGDHLSEGSDFSDPIGEENPQDINDNLINNEHGNNANPNGNDIINPNGNDIINPNGNGANPKANLNNIPEKFTCDNEVKNYFNYLRDLGLKTEDINSIEDGFNKLNTDAVVYDSKYGNEEVLNNLKQHLSELKSATSKFSNGDVLYKKILDMLYSKWRFEWTDVDLICKSQKNKNFLSILLNEYNSIKIDSNPIIENNINNNINNNIHIDNLPEKFNSEQQILKQLNDLGSKYVKDYTSIKNSINSLPEYNMDELPEVLTKLSSDLKTSLSKIPGGNAFYDGIMDFLHTKYSCLWENPTLKQELVLSKLDKNVESNPNGLNDVLNKFENKFTNMLDKDVSLRDLKVRYNELCNELNQKNPNLDRCMDIVDDINNFFNQKGIRFSNLNQNIYLHLYMKYYNLWKVPNSIQTDILAMLKAEV